MISGQIRLSDGNFEIIRNADDFARIVEDKLGYDAAQMVRDLANKATREAAIADTDIISYESELSELHQAIDELQRMSRFLLPLSNKDRLSSADREELRRLAHIIRALAS
jgi:hypothetical protein